MFKTSTQRRRLPPTSTLPLIHLGVLPGRRRLEDHRLQPGRGQPHAAARAPGPRETARLYGFASSPCCSGGSVYPKSTSLDHPDLSGQVGLGHAVHPAAVRPRTSTTRPPRSRSSTARPASWSRPATTGRASTRTASWRCRRPPRRPTRRSPRAPVAPRAAARPRSPSRPRRRAPRSSARWTRRASRPARRGSPTPRWPTASTASRSAPGTRPGPTRPRPPARGPSTPPARRAGHHEPGGRRHRHRRRGRGQRHRRGGRVRAGPRRRRPGRHGRDGRPAGAWTLTLTLADGAHALTAVATDAAGNASPPATAVGVTVDTQAPDTTIDAVPAGTANGASCHVLRSASPAPDVASFECALDAAPYAACTSPRALAAPGRRLAHLQGPRDRRRRQLPTPPPRSAPGRSAARPTRRRPRSRRPRRPTGRPASTSPRSRTRRSPRTSTRRASPRRASRSRPREARARSPRPSPTRRRSGRRS